MKTSNSIPSLAALAGICLAFPLSAAPAPSDLRVGEGFVEPIGFYDPAPTLSWKLPAAAGVKTQSAYRVVAATKAEALPDAADLWDSGKVESDDSVWIHYAGKKLASRHAVHWQVMFWDQNGKPSPWSLPARFELGLLETSAWQAQWIGMNPETKVENTRPQAANIVIEKALYGEQGKPGRLVDVSETLKRLLAGKQWVVTVGNELAGRDPAFGVPKSLTLVIIRDGKREEIVIPEKARYNMATGDKHGVAGTAFVPQYLRREFEVAKPVRSARLHVTARGVFEVRLNGNMVGADFMAPGWTPYSHKIETLTYDVTGQIREGSNAIGAILGEGWYAGGIGRKRWSQGRLPQFLLQLEITHADGTISTIATDAGWKATDEGPIRFSSIYDGENYDARRQLADWDAAGFDAAGWQPVSTEKPSSDIALAPKRHHPVRVTKEIPAIKVTEPQPGRFVFDLGQNIVGWPALKIPVRKDQMITLRFAEMLEKDGTLYTANYRGAKSTDTYTAATDGTVTWQPTFTFHGFRYVELSGFPEGTRPEKDWVTGTVLHSDFGWTGNFTSSHKLLNQLQSNITWGLRGNFLDIPTDCPQRDERLGWTGDAQVFAPAALFNADVHAFLASWLESMRLDQQQDGSIPSVVPDVLGKGCGGPGWADAATVIPWELYVRTGDLGVLKENFEMMRRWVGWYEGVAKNHVIGNIHAYGDWLQPYPKGGNQRGDTPLELIGTAYFARSADFTARAARCLGRTEEAEHLEALFAEVKKAFVGKFFNEKGKLTTPAESQTGYLLALGFDLLPESMRAGAAENLVRLVGEAGGHLRTGFLGTPLLAPVLDRFGHTDLAYGVLFKETYPSWFYSIHQGATTMWERWNSYSHADGFGDAGMNSFNHYAYGAIGQWMYERIAGLAADPAQPGYRHFFIRPVPGGPLSSARAELETPYGKAVSAWNIDNGILKLEAVVPPNTTATLMLPGRDANTLTPGRHEIESKLP